MPVILGRYDHLETLNSNFRNDNPSTVANFDRYATHIFGVKF